jgi:hypothetical protein
MDCYKDNFTFNCTLLYTTFSIFLLYVICVLYIECPAGGEFIDKSRKCSETRMEGDVS